MLCFLQFFRNFFIVFFSIFLFFFLQFFCCIFKVHWNIVIWIFIQRKKELENDAEFTISYCIFSYISLHFQCKKKCIHIFAVCEERKWKPFSLKGGLFLENFLLWLKSPKQKSAKSLSWAPFPHPLKLLFNSSCRGCLQFKQKSYILDV